MIASFTSSSGYSAGDFLLPSPKWLLTWACLAFASASGCRRLFTAAGCLTRRPDLPLRWLILSNARTSRLRPGWARTWTRKRMEDGSVFGFRNRFLFWHFVLLFAILLYGWLVVVAVWLMTKVRFVCFNLNSQLTREILIPNVGRCERAFLLVIFVWVFQVNYCTRFHGNALRFNLFPFHNDYNIDLSQLYTKVKTKLANSWQNPNTNQTPKDTLFYLVKIIEVYI